MVAVTGSVALLGDTLHNVAGPVTAVPLPVAFGAARRTANDRFTYFSGYNKTYGSLAGVIVFLLWIWLTNLALLFGAEVDAELERASQLQAGIEAEEEIRLSPRDTQAAEKRERKRDDLVREGRRLRTEANDTSDQRPTRQ